MTEMNGAFFLDNDQDLQTLLTTALPLVGTMKIASRMFIEIPQDDYNNAIPEVLGGDGTVKFCDVFKDFCKGNEAVSEAYLLVGEHTDAYGSAKSGSRNLIDNAMTKEEIQAWIDYFGVDKFHVGFPNVEEAII